MSWRSTVFRLAALALAAGLLPSCGAEIRDESLGGDILKISYYRVNPEAKTKRPEPTYRVLLSNSWHDHVGENPREPYPQAAPGQVYKGFADDIVVRRYLDKLQGMGLLSLRARNPDDVNSRALLSMAIDPKEMDSKEGYYTRVITVGTDKGAKSYFYRDQQTSPEGIETFRTCERYVASVMAGHTIKVQVLTDPREKTEPAPKKP